MDTGGYMWNWPQVRRFSNIDSRTCGQICMEHKTERRVAKINKKTAHTNRPPTIFVSIELCYDEYHLRIRLIFII